VLALPQKLTHEFARTCLDQLKVSLGSESAQVVIDATALQQFDSSALAVLLELRRECARLGKRFAVQSMPDRLRDLARLYGIDSLLAPASAGGV
jgi:phospholipid transport system transporter-binding protein